MITQVCRLCSQKAKKEKDLAFCECYKTNEGWMMNNMFTKIAHCVNLDNKTTILRKAPSCLNRTMKVGR